MWIVYRALALTRAFGIVHRISILLMNNIFHVLHFQPFCMFSTSSLGVPAERRAWRKQFLIVADVTQCQDLFSIFIASKTEMVNFSLFSQASMGYCMKYFLKWDFRLRITPWSMGWIFDVIFYERNISSIELKLSTSGYVGQLSKIKRISFFLCSSFPITGVPHGISWMSSTLSD